MVPHQHFGKNHCSLHNVLSILSVAATDKSKEELLQFLSLDTEHDSFLEDSYHSLTEFYDSLEAQTLTTASSVWYQDGLEINQSFTDTVNKTFGAYSSCIDFNLENSTDVVNEWISESTDGLITNLVEKFPQETSVFLANAVHFKDKWYTPFQDEDEDGNSLENSKFYLDENTTISVPMMVTTNKDIRVADLEDQNITFVRIPYNNENFTMTLLVCENIDDLDFHDSENIFHASWSAEERLTEDVKLIMPKFELSTKTEMSNILKLNNVTQIFEGNICYV